MYSADTLALAFTLGRWPERRKAEVWATLQTDQDPFLNPLELKDLEHWSLELPRLQEAAHRLGARIVLPSQPGTEHLWPRLPYPVALWVRGTLPPPLCIALVGARKASRLGLERARTWAKTLTAAGLGVLSGLARGIDGAAHCGALEAGPTWGVLGSGLSNPYPREHVPLMDRMVAAGGGVITPFPPEAAPHAWHFPRRNLLLAAWSHGVVVVESQLKSGSLVTARLALDLGRDLWACPGAPEDPGAEGPNALLREGCAHPARHPQDILEDLAGLRDLTAPGPLVPSSQAWSHP